MATITGTAGNDGLTGTSGDDVIDGGGGIDTINAGAGDDIVRLIGGIPLGNTNFAMLDGGPGYDVLDLTGWQGGYLFVSGDTIQQIDVVGDTQVRTYVARFSGFEEIRIGPDGGSVSNMGIETTYPAPDTLPSWKFVGGSAADYLGDTRGSDVIDAAGGNDIVTFSGGSDRVTLGAGDDQYQLSHPSGFAEHVTIDGGAGVDTLSVSNLAAAEDVTVDLAAGTGQMQLVQLTQSGFENLSINNDVGLSLAARGEFNLALPWHGMVAGDDGANVLNVSSVGDAVLLGRGGDDQIIGSLTGEMTAYGGPGNDSIEGGKGNDWINGGGHYVGDTIPATTTGDGADTLSGEEGNDHIFGNAQFAVQGAVDGADLIDAGRGMDYVNGNGGSDTIYGNDGPDRLYGGAGDDLIWGDAGRFGEAGSGNDHINGNKGNDTLHGGDGDDEILGGQGDDLIDGGNGVDTLSGNTGSDTFYLNGSAHFSVSGPQANMTDVITDYQDGQDRFEPFYPVAAVLHPGSAVDFASALALAKSVLPVINFPAVNSQDVAAVQVGADTYLFLDNLGHGPESAVRLLNVNASAIDTSDFVLI